MTKSETPLPPRLKMNLRRCVLAYASSFVLVFLSLIATKGEAQTLPPEENDGWVEVRKNDDAYLPYRDRRESHGWQFGLHVENYKPDQFTSSIDGAKYTELFGDSEFSMAVIEAGYKFNFMLGSLSLLVGYGQGGIDAEYFAPSATASEKRSLTMKKNHVSLMYIADSLFGEPYIAPYGSFGIYKMAIDETAPSSGINISGETGTATQTTVGALIQLNWIEETVSRWAWISLGLENTYLDVFMTNYGAPSDSADPDTSTAMNYGFGLRVEF